MAKQKVIIVIEEGTVKYVKKTSNDIEICVVDFDNHDSDGDITGAVNVLTDDIFDGNWADAIDNKHTKLKEYLHQLDQEFPLSYESSYGISEEDIIDEARRKHWIISDETIEDAQRLYDKRMDFSGSGFHGAQLIDYVLDELANERTAEVDAAYVSVWDGGMQIRTNCKFNTISNVVSNISSADVEELDNLEREYVKLPDGTEIEKFFDEDRNIFVGLTDEEEAEYEAYMD